MVATNVQTLDRSPKTTAARQRTREDIYDLVERASKSAEAALTRSDEHVATTVRLEGKIDLVVKALGSESLDEYGAKVGTGIAGRLMRLEIAHAKKSRLIDDWRKLAIGFAVAIVPAAYVIWWLVNTRLAAVLR